jgi:enediyne biosynthesis protein E4
MRRCLCLLAAGVMAACEGPGPVPAVDAGLQDAAVSDAARPDDASGPDVSPADASPADAFLPDVAATDAAPPDVTWNPNGISFVDVTAETIGHLPGGAMRMDRWSVGSGVGVGDLDGDGRPDIFLARNDEQDTEDELRGGPSTILWNEGGWQLTTDEALPAVTGGRRGHSVAFGDLDGDGDLDVFLGMEGPDLLLRNDGGRTFTDVTTAAGVAGPDGDVTMGALFADLNDDGRLDLYVSNYSLLSPPWPSDIARNRLYLNLPDGSFLDVSALSGADNPGATQAAAVIDAEGDGVPTLVVANDRFCMDDIPILVPLDDMTPDAWLRRTSVDEGGVPHFLDEGEARGMSSCRSSMGVGVADVDGDLLPDVYLTDIGPNELYLGGPVLEERAGSYNVKVSRDPDGYRQTSWGARFLDLDRDGSLELFVVNGSVGELCCCIDYHQLDVLLRARTPGGRFGDITRTTGLPSDPVCRDTGVPLAGRGATTGDLDGDGDDDLVISPWIEGYRVFENRTSAAGASVRLRATGTVSAADPVGATLLVTLPGGVQRASFRVAGGDTHSQSDGLIEVGLGDTTPDRVELLWPSGHVQRLSPTDTIVVEPAWLTVEPRVAAPADPLPRLVYRPVDALGAPLGAGREVTVLRSDGLSVTVVDEGDGSYTATLAHPGAARRTTVTVVDSGVTLRPRPLLLFQL